MRRTLHRPNQADLDSNVASVSPAMMGWESNFPYTYTPIYYTAEDVANWTPPSSDPPSDPSSDTSTGASPNPHHLTKRSVS
ncbi:unnamed protein product [Aureobasidium pullulans]|nr:unnamed protein product [Aureobasidium pullulans]